MRKEILLVLYAFLDVDRWIIIAWSKISSTWLRGGTHWVPDVYHIGSIMGANYGSYKQHISGQSRRVPQSVHPMYIVQSHSLALRLIWSSCDSRVHSSFNLRWSELYNLISLPYPPTLPLAINISITNPTSNHLSYENNTLKYRDYPRADGG